MAGFHGNGTMNGVVSPKIKQLTVVAEDEVHNEKNSSGAGSQDPQASNFSVKHPLQSRWTLWFDNQKQKKKEESWEESLKNIMTFDTVEDFWCLHGNILPPSRLLIGSNYSVFKAGVKPMWEDPCNRLGGKWVLTINKMDRKSMDDWWLHAMLAVIGEILEPDENDEEVCGLVASLRKDRAHIALWTKTAASMELQNIIGKSFRRALALPHGCELKYQSHNESLQSGSSFRNQALYSA